MDHPSPRLFHLHFHVADVSRAEQVFGAAGLDLYRQYSRIDGEIRGFDADEDLPDEGTFYLAEFQRGYANVAITRGPELRFDHFGVYVDDVGTVVDRGIDEGWSVPDPESDHPFLVTPWDFRIELHGVGEPAEQSLGAWRTAHFDAVELVVPGADVVAVRAGIGEVVGAISGLGITGDEVDRPTVSTVRLAGEAFPSLQTIWIDALSRPGTKTES